MSKNVRFGSETAMPDMDTLLRGGHSRNDKQRAQDSKQNLNRIFDENKEKNQQATIYKSQILAHGITVEERSKVESDNNNKTPIKELEQSTSKQQVLTFDKSKEKAPSIEEKKGAVEISEEEIKKQAKKKKKEEKLKAMGKERKEAVAIAQEILDKLHYKNYNPWKSNLVLEKETFFQEFQSQLKAFISAYNYGYKESLKEILNRFVDRAIRIRGKFSTKKILENEQPEITSLSNCISENQELLKLKKRYENVNDNFNNLLRDIKIQKIETTLPKPDSFEKNIFETLDSICRKNQNLDFLGGDYVSKLLSKCKQELLDQSSVSNIGDSSPSRDEKSSTKIRTQYLVGVFEETPHDNLLTAVQVAQSRYMAVEECVNKVKEAKAVAKVDYFRYSKLEFFAREAIRIEHAIQEAGDNNEDLHKFIQEAKNKVKEVESNVRGAGFAYAEVNKLVEKLLVKAKEVETAFPVSQFLAIQLDELIKKVQAKTKEANMTFLVAQSRYNDLDRLAKRFKEAEKEAEKESNEVNAILISDNPFVFALNIPPETQTTNTLKESDTEEPEFRGF